jgi:hypothetical protein
VVVRFGLNVAPTLVAERTFAPDLDFPIAWGFAAGWDFGCREREVWREPEGCLGEAGCAAPDPACFRAEDCPAACFAA